MPIKPCISLSVYIEGGHCNLPFNIAPGVSQEQVPDIAFPKRSRRNWLGFGLSLDIDRSGLADPGVYGDVCFLTERRRLL